MKTILIAILAGLAVVLVGVLGYQKLTQPATTLIVVNQPATNQPVVKQPVINKPVVQPQDETAGWKTYANEQYGFEVKYLENWYSGLTYWNKNMNDLAYKYSTDRYYIVDFSDSANNVSGRQADFVGGNNGYIGVSRLKENILDAQKYFDNILKPTEGVGAGPVVFKNYLTVDGFKALKTEQSMPGTAGIINVFVIKDNTVTIISLLLPDTARTEPICDQYEKVFDYMVSTFKFIK